jgi:ferritin-like metal-binding protein YciE
MAHPKQRDRTLRDLFIARLTDAHDSERQLIKTLPEMATAAQDPKLKSALSEHLAECQKQVQLVEQVLGLLHVKPRARAAGGISGIIDEASDAVDTMTASPVRDAALAAAGRLAGHYKLAMYGSLIAMGDALGHANACKRLRAILVKEEAAEKRLSELCVAALKLAQEEMPVEA